MRKRILLGEIKDDKKMIDGRPSFDRSIIINNFRWLAENGYTWRDVLKCHIFDNIQLESERNGARQVVEQLFEQKGPLEQYLYKRVIARLLQDENEHRYQINVDWQNKNGLKFYTIKVSFIGDSSTQPLLEAEVMAPGSKELTSDIDTTISIKTISPELTNAINWPDAIFGNASHISSLDIKVALQAAIIFYFDSLNYEFLGISSAESRDSNVYSDGFMSNSSYFEKPYVILELSELTSDVRDAYRRCFNEMPEESLQPLKRKRHRLELAASLLSLREYYGDSSTKWDQDFKYFNFLQTGSGRLAKHGEFNQDIQLVFKEVEELYSYKLSEQEALKNKEEFKNSYEAISLLSKPGLNPLEGITIRREIDYSAHVDNFLYAKDLVLVAQARKNIEINLKKLHGKVDILNKQFLKHANEVRLIPKFESELNKINEDVEGIKKELLDKDPNSYAYKALQNALKSSQEEKNKKQEELLKLKQGRENPAQLSQMLDDYKKTLEETAELLYKHQELMVKANLFANEAYLNYAAPYHVVRFLQKQEDVSIEKRHVLLSSVLQQIGFRLLHAKIYREQGMTEGEILYRVAKYDERIAGMFFGDKKKWNLPPDMHKLHKTGKFLQRLDKGISSNSRNRESYDLAFFQFLLRGSRLVQQVKKDSKIEIYQKGLYALILCKKFFLASQSPDLAEESSNYYQNNYESPQLSLMMKGIESQEFNHFLQSGEKLLITSAQKLILDAYYAKIMAKFNKNASAKSYIHAWGVRFLSLPNARAEVVESSDEEPTLKKK